NFYLPGALRSALIADACCPLLAVGRCLPVRTGCMGSSGCRSAAARGGKLVTRAVPAGPGFRREGSELLKSFLAVARASLPCRTAEGLIGAGVEVIKRNVYSLVNT